MSRMRQGSLFILMLLLAVPLAAAPGRKPGPRPAPKPPAEQKLIQSCDAHKFETVVDTMVDGQPRKSKVKLCGVEGQSDAEWIGTLKDAIAKLEANKAMAAATREQIVAAIRAEIARLNIVGTPVKREANDEPAAPLSRDYAALPPLPPAPETQPIKSAPAAPVDLPAAVPAAPLQPAPVMASIPASVPRLTINCQSPADLGGPAPCIDFERETRVTITADGEVPAGTSIEFVRNGRAQGDVPLGGLRKGGVLRIGLPRNVCAGFGAGRLELRIVQAGASQPVRSEGPFSLRC